MKTMISFSTLLLLTFQFTFAQQGESGVYFTPQDFKNGKLEYAINCKTEKHKIKLNDFLDKPYITVIHEGKRYEHQKKDIFGYRDCEGIDYRFVNNGNYPILNPRENIVLYKLIQGVDSKTSKRTISYFFSNGLDGNVVALTVENLKAAFSDNHKFHDLLDTEFGSGTVALTDYDSFHKIYKVNRLYQNSQK